MGNCRLLLLGPPQVQRGEQVVRIKLRKAVALVAYLAVEKRAFSREYLAALLWPQLGQPDALHNLRQTLSVLRETFANGCIGTEGDQVELREEFVNVDVDEFHSLTVPEDSDTDLARLEAACGLYRGSFLEGFNLGKCEEFDHWQDAVRERLRSQFDELLETLSKSYLQMGEPKLAYPHAQRWLELDYWNEAAHRALMEIHARVGRTAAALKQFKSCTRILSREGMEPDDLTRELNDAIAENHLTPSASQTGVSNGRPGRLSTGKRRDASRRFGHGFAFVCAVVLAGLWFVIGFINREGNQFGPLLAGGRVPETIKVRIEYNGDEPLDDANPLKVFIGDLTQHRGPEDWGQFTASSEGGYSFPLDEVPVHDSDGSGYFMMVVHDAGDDLQDPYGHDPGDVAGLYTDVAGNLVYGGFNVASGTPIYPGERYSIDFALPPVPAADKYETDDRDDLATSIDYDELPVRQYHTIHFEESGDIDWDWFRIFLEAGDLVTVETFSAGGRWESDTVIEIYDSDLNRIQSVGNKSFEDNFSRLPYRNTTGVDQAFHILVKLHDYSWSEVHRIGEYVVEFRQ